MNWKDFKDKKPIEETIRKLGVLILDDEEEITESFSLILKKHFEVFSSSDPNKAFEIFLCHSPKIIISDQRMPGMTGLEFFSRIKHNNPDTIRILITGFSDIKVLIEAVNNGLLFKYLEKPFDTKVLVNTALEGAKQYVKKMGLEESYKELINLPDYEFENFSW